MIFMSYLSILKQFWYNYVIDQLSDPETLDDLRGGSLAVTPPPTSVVSRSFDVALAVPLTTQDDHRGSLAVTPSTSVVSGSSDFALVAPPTTLDDHRGPMAVTPSTSVVSRSSDVALLAPPTTVDDHPGPLPITPPTSVTLAEDQPTTSTVGGCGKFQNIISSYNFKYLKFSILKFKIFYIEV